MATTYRPSVRTDTDQLDGHGVLLVAAYVGFIVATIAVGTGAVALLVGFTSGLGQFVLVTGGWLAVVGASPEIAARCTARLAEVKLGQRVPRSSRAVTAIVTYVLAR